MNGLMNLKQESNVTKDPSRIPESTANATAYKTRILVQAITDFNRAEMRTPRFRPITAVINGRRTRRKSEGTR